jgi:type IV pilus assembly protein PilF
MRRAAAAALCATGLVLSGCTTSILGGSAASAAASSAANKGTASPQPQVPDQKPDPKEAARLRVELASLYFSRGSIGPALDEANSAAKLDPENAQAFNLLGLINMQLKEDAQASLNFERALRLAGNDPDINNNYGWFLCQTGRQREAIAEFLAALRDPLYATPARPLTRKAAGMAIRI